MFDVLNTASFLSSHARDPYVQYTRERACRKGTKRKAQGKKSVRRRDVEIFIFKSTEIDFDENEALTTLLQTQMAQIPLWLALY